MDANFCSIIAVSADFGVVEYFLERACFVAFGTSRGTLVVYYSSICEYIGYSGDCLSFRDIEVKVLATFQQVNILKMGLYFFNDFW